MAGLRAYGSPASRLAGRPGLVLGVAVLLAASAARAEPDLARARAFVERSQYPQAVSLLDGAEGPEARELRGFCRMKLKDYEGACEDFEAGDPTDPYHDVNYAYCLRKTARPLAALEAFERAIRRLPPSDAWASEAARHVRELAPLRDARRVLGLRVEGAYAIVRAGGRERLRLAPGEDGGLDVTGAGSSEDAEVRILIVNVAGGFSYQARVTGEGRPRGDIARTGPEAPELAGVVGDLVIRAAPEPGASAIEDRAPLDALLAAAARSEARWQAGALDEAIEMDEASAERFGSVGWFHRRVVERCRERALALPVSAGTRQAREALLARAARAQDRYLHVRRKVAALVPGDVEALGRAGSVAATLGRLPEAEQHYRMAIAASPDTVGPQIGLAQVLTRLGRGDAAVDAARAAVDRAPRSPMAHVVLGDALLARGEADPALRAYQRAVALDPADGEWIYGKIAAATNATGANGLAIERAERALAERGADADAVRDLGEALLRGLRYEEAQALLEQALALDPDVARASALAGLAAELVGDARAALEHYERAARGGEDPLARMAKRRMERIRALARGGALTEPSPATGSIGQAADSPAKARALAALRAIQGRSRRLAAGLASLPPLCDGAIEEREATALERIGALAERASQSDAELRAGLGQVIRRITRRPAGAPRPDGGLADWIRADLVERDPEGDAPAPAADLAEVYGVVMGEVLHVALRCYGAPDPSAYGYWVEVRAEPPLGTLAAGVGGGAEPTAIIALPARAPRRLVGSRSGVVSAAGEVVELDIPLRWIRRARPVRLHAFTFDATRSIRVDELPGRWPVVHVDEGVPWALFALLDLAADEPLEGLERVAVAIALAAGEGYAIGGDARGLARKEARGMLRVAREQAAAQRARGWPPLPELPLAPLLTWATRELQYRPSSFEGAIRYAVSTDALDAMARYAETAGLVRSSVGATVEAIEAHLGAPDRWQYTSAVAVEQGLRRSRGAADTLSPEEERRLARFVRPCVVDGEEVTTDGRFNQDLQFDYLLATDALLGHCGNMAQLTVDVCRALGIPATIAQGREERSDLYESPHAFPIYFDASRGSWGSVQGRRYQGSRPLALYVFLPLAFDGNEHDLVRETGVGTHWYRWETTYDDVGRAFRVGAPLAWYDELLAGR